MQVKEPIIESVLNQANQLYKDYPPSQSDKVSKSNAVRRINFHEIYYL